jgi:hypothetical protein
MTASNNRRSSYSRLLAAEHERRPPPAAVEQSTEDAFLAERAERIKTFTKRARGEIIQIGKLLSECKEHCDHGDWLPWLDREFDWDGRTAERFMSVYRLSLEIDNLSNLDLSDSTLYLLAAPKTPTGARAEVVDRTGNGQRLRYKDVYDIVEQHKPARMGSRYSACNLNYEADPPEEPNYPAPPEWPFNIEAAEWQAGEAMRLARQYGLFRPGTRPEDFTEERAAKAREVAQEWLSVADRIDTERTAADQPQPATPRPRRRA